MYKFFSKVYIFSFAYEENMLYNVYYNADVAELADAHGSGPCEGSFMGVRVPSSAPIYLYEILCLYHTA